MTARSRLWVEGLWRYPVKSLGAEPLHEAWLSEDGLPGDRVVHVQGSRGPLTGRTRHGLLAVPGGTAPDGTPLVGDEPWHSAEAAARVRAVAGEEARLVRWDGPERFDVATLLVATDGAVRRWGHDVRRLRPNLLLGGAAADDELGWAGRAVAVGGALVGLLSRRARCIVTSIDPVSGAQDLDAFRRVRRVFGNQLGLDAWVIRPGLVGVGDEARLVETDRAPLHVGGWVVGAPYLVPGPPTDGPPDRPSPATPPR